MANTVFIQINDVCNEKCVFCNRPPTGINGNIPAEDVYKRIDKAVIDDDVSDIVITGGEPLLHPQLPAIVRYAARRQRTMVQTNGTLVDKGAILMLTDAGVSSVNIAYHSHIKKVSDVLRGTDKGFEDIERGVRLLLSSPIETRVIHVISSLNYEYLPDFTNHIDSLTEGRTGNFINFTFIVPEGRAFENKSIIPDPFDVEPYLKEAVGIAIANGIKVDISEVAPLCALKGFEQYLVGPIFAKNGIRIIDDYCEGKSVLDFNILQGKTDRCRSCARFDDCMGMYPKYLEIFGDGKFMPYPDQKNDL